MSLVIQDANIIIDLIAAEIFEEFFRLDLEVVTTSLVLDEIIDEHQRFLCECSIDQNQLKVQEITTFEFLQLRSMNLTGLTVQDRSVLKLAKERNAILLTGDRKLRNVAQSQKIKVCGILWIFDALVAQSVLSKEEASTKLKVLKNSNVRLPVNEVDKRLMAWII